MVCNLQNILDEGKIKYVNETNMSKLSEAEKVYNECVNKNIKSIIEENWDPEQGKFRETEIRNEGYAPYPEKSRLRWFMIEKRKDIWEDPIKYNINPHTPQFLTFSQKYRGNITIENYG